VYNIFLKHLLVSYANLRRFDSQLTVSELKEVGVREKELLPLFNNSFTIYSRTNNISIKIQKELKNAVKINVSKNNIKMVIENFDAIYENVDSLQVKTSSLAYNDFFSYLNDPEKLLRSYVIMSKDSPTNKKVLSKITNKILDYFSTKKKLEEITSDRLFDYYLRTMGKLILERKIDTEIISKKLQNSRIRQRLIDIIVERNRSVLPIYIVALEKYLTVSELNGILSYISKEDISNILTYLNETGNTELVKVVTKFLNTQEPGKKNRLVL
ncbi:hypothetical protein, partial [Desulfurobacterium sp.]|uniref:hypothetical protein n=1 Tax=Desulfurobacterium sp. TaxID=2004706 RepID=UPI002620FE96